MIALLFIGLYFVPAFFIQPKLALANYETLSDYYRKRANSRAMWQSLIWPVMVIMLRGHKAIENKKSTESALTEARRIIAGDIVRTNPEMAEWDRNAGISSGRAILQGAIEEKRYEVSFADLTRADLGRKAKFTDRFGQKKQGVIKAIEFKEAHDILDIGEGWSFPKPNMKITFLD